MRTWTGVLSGMTTVLALASMFLLGMQTPCVPHHDCGIPKVPGDLHKYDYVAIAGSAKQLASAYSQALAKRANGIGPRKLDLNMAPATSPESDPLSMLASTATRTYHNEKKREERRARRERALRAPEAPMILLKGRSKRSGETSAEYLLRVRRTNAERNKRYKRQPEVREVRRQRQKEYDDEHKEAKRERDRLRYQRHKDSISAKAKKERQLRGLKAANARALEQAGGKPRSDASASAPQALRKRSSEDAVDAIPSQSGRYEPLDVLAQAAHRVETADRKRRERHTREQRARLAPAGAPMVFIRGKKRQEVVESAAEYLKRVRTSKRQSDIKWKSRTGVHEAFKAHKRETWNARKDIINARRRELRSLNKDEFNRKRRERWKLKKESQAKSQDASYQDPSALVKRASGSSRRIDLNKSPLSTPSPPSDAEKPGKVSTDSSKQTVMEERRKRKNELDRLSYAARMKRVKEANPGETVVLLHGSTSLANEEYIDRIRKRNRESQARRLKDPKHRDAKREMDRARYQRKRGAIREYSRSYYAANREEYLAKVRERRKRLKLKKVADSESAASRTPSGKNDREERSDSTPPSPSTGPVKRSLWVSWSEPDSIYSLLQYLFEHGTRSLERSGQIRKGCVGQLNAAGFQKRSNDPPPSQTDASTYDDPLLTLADAAREAEAKAARELKGAKDKARKAIRRQRPEVRELMRQRSRQYYETHKQAVRARETAYRTQNRERVNRLARDRRRARAKAKKEQGPSPDEVAKAMQKRSPALSVV